MGYEKPKKSDFTVKIKDKDISRSLKKYMQSLSYTDSATGESDALSVTIGDRERKWLGSWMPDKGDRITAVIKAENWRKYGDNLKLDCGDFIIDTLSANGEPLVLEIGAISGPVSSGFRETSRHKTWKKTNIKNIALVIAKRYKLTLHYDAASVPVKEIEQSDSDSSFLQSLCESYGLTMKAYRKKLVVFDRERYKKKTAKVTIDRKTTAIEDWSFTDTLTRRYTGGQLTYTDPNTDKEVKKTVGKKTVLLKVEDSADSAADAERKIKAAVNKENHSKTTASINMIGDTRIVSGICVNLKNFGSNMSGKYYVDQATHSLDADGGYKLALELSKVGKSI